MVLLPQLISEFSKQAKNNPSRTLEFAIADHASKSLNKWKLRGYCVGAALLVPLLRNSLLDIDQLKTLASENSINLAKQYIDWQASKAARENSSTDIQKTRSEELRELIHQIYINLPDFSFILFVIAFHEATLKFSFHDVKIKLDSKAQSFLIQETEELFIPITKILGLWKIRRTWFEETAKIIDSKKYDLMLKWIGGHLATTEIKLREEYLRISQNYKNAHSSSSKAHHNKNSRIHLEKALTYSQFEESFKKECAAEEHRLITKTFPLLQVPGPSLRAIDRNLRTMTEEEYKNKMGIRIFCRTESDCYRVLGIIHKLGTPVATRDPDKYYDYISEPNPNGYQALHTQVVLRTSKSLIQFRILTIKMYRLNEGGILTSQYKYPKQYQNIKAWWSQNQIKKLSSLLHNEYGIRDNIKSYLQKNNILSNSDPIYVFTPDGEIKLLPQNSTTIDYAYNIHTKMVDYYIGSKINGERFSDGHKLVNGDLVHIQHDTHSIGPNLSFLFFARTQKALSKIRRALIRRAALVHKGREILEKKLIRVYEIYRNKNLSQDVPISTYTWSFDSFLDRIRLHNKFNQIDDLYKAIEEGQINSDKIVNLFITESLIGLWPEILKEYPSMPMYKMSLCEFCWPAPNENIRLGIRRDNGIVIHSSKCSRIDQDCIIDIVPKEEKITRRTYKIEIIGQDNFRLLGNVLDKIYTSGVSLLNLNAQVLENREAVINVMIVAESPEQVRNLKSEIEKVHHISRVYYFSYADKLSNSYSSEYHNPYAYSDQLVNHMFFDRTDSFSTIYAWLSEDSPAHALVLHGSRRVGKTTLAKHVAETLHKEKIASMQMIPIIVNFDGVSVFEPANIASHIATPIMQTIKGHYPSQKSFINPFTWLGRILHTALSQIGNRRILLILDEFNNIIEQEQISNRFLIKNLRAAINSFTKIKWLLITQELYFQDAKLLDGAEVLLQEAPEIFLEDLPKNYALKLIKEPSDGINISFQEGVPDEIYNLTSGNAYLIQVICYYLIDEIRKKNRTQIIKEDLDDILSILLTDGRHFAHLSKPVKTELQKRIIACVANKTSQNDNVSIEEVQKTLGISKSKLLNLFNQEIEKFVRLGLLGLENSETGNKLHIPIKIFKLWLLSSYQREIRL